MAPATMERPGARGGPSSDRGVAWLLTSNDPSVRYLTLTDVLRRTNRHADVRAAQEAVLDGPKVRALLSGQRRGGGFGVHPYGKWTGAHWRLVSLVELAIPAGEPRAMAALEEVLRWLTRPARMKRIRTMNGLVRRCASQEGNALAVACRLGLASDPRVGGLAEGLTVWQWPDGGWNCSVKADANHSSFHESLAPLWGLVEHHRATGEPRSKEAADRAAEFFLRHRLYKSERTGEVIDPKWLELHYPPYWHYDVLQGLVILGRAGRLADPRVSDALRLIEGKRRPDGRWRVDGARWKRVGTGTHAEVVDWGRTGPNERVTLNALRFLSAAGRWTARKEAGRSEDRPASQLAAETMA